MRAALAPAVLSFVLIFSDSNALRAQSVAATERLPVPPNITILLDLSYSMRLPLSLNKDDVHGTTRLEEAKRLLQTLLRRENPAVRWSLLTFGGERADHNEDTRVRVVQGFTEDTSILRREIDRQSTWGLTPLGDALLFAERYVVRGAPQEHSIILVVSDGIDTVPALYELPSADTLRQFPARIVFAGIGLQRAPDLAAALRAWMERAGGVYVDAADPSAVISAIEAHLHQSPSTQLPVEAARIAPAVASNQTTGGRTDPPPASRPRVQSFSLPSWLPPWALAAALLLVLVFPLILLLSRRLRWMRARKRIRALRTSQTVARFQREAKGEIKQFETVRSRVSLVPSDWKRPTSVLPVVEIKDGNAVVSSPGPIVINGVGLHRKSLEAGDRIHIPGYLWTFRGIEIRASGPPDPPRPRALPHLVAFLTLSCLGLFVWYLHSPVPQLPGSRVASVPAAASPSATVPPATAAAVPAAGTSHAPAASVARTAVAGAAHPTAVAAIPAPAAGAAQALPAAAAVAAVRAPAAGAASVAAVSLPVVARRIPETNIALAGNLARVRPFVHTQMIAPGAKPDYFKADIMFIHAHPDDVSINFGGLLAMEARAGKRIVSVVFTDGNAGLDQYPYRHVGGRYPSRSLSGTPLARVRVEEEDSALSILGSRAYVRLGLRNNPYDSITEILPLGEVLRRWGGEAHVVSELVKLLEGYRPTIVVSPDKHHYGVFTHFEHEAVGYVTDVALSYLRNHGQDFVRAHLIGVDPMLTGEYHHVFGIDVMRTDPATGLTYRAIQVAALEQHRSQRDASVIAVEVVPNFDDEYYVAKFWNLPTPPARYFSPLRALAGLPGRQP